jgi:hypothetical protein
MGGVRAVRCFQMNIYVLVGKAADGCLHFVNINGLQANPLLVVHFLLFYMKQAKERKYFVLQNFLL